MVELHAFVLQVTGEGLLVVFNPISGVSVEERGGIINLGYHLTQAFLMQHADEQYLKVTITDLLNP